MMYNLKYKVDDLVVGNCDNIIYRIIYACNDLNLYTVKVYRTPPECEFKDVYKCNMVFKAVRFDNQSKKVNEEVIDTLFEDINGV